MKNATAITTGIKPITKFDINISNLFFSVAKKKKNGCL